MGNIVNRVFDSSGPEGKVRGTPQQIIDKYNQLARDAQLANDRVAAENFQQHAEHYARLLGEAQREQDARREQQEAQQNRDREQQDAQQTRDRDQQRPDDEQPQPQPARFESGQQGEAYSRGGKGSADVIDIPDDSSESTLVDTPEDKPAPKPRRPRKPRAPKGSASGEDDQPEAGDQPSAPAAE
jgi:sRNA-binding protein